MLAAGKQQSVAKPGEKYKRQTSGSSTATEARPGSHASRGGPNAPRADGRGAFLQRPCINKSYGGIHKGISAAKNPVIGGLRQGGAVKLPAKGVATKIRSSSGDKSAPPERTAAGNLGDALLSRRTSAESAPTSASLAIVEQRVPLQALRAAGRSEQGGKGAAGEARASLQHDGEQETGQEGIGEPALRGEAPAASLSEAQSASEVLFQELQALSAQAKLKSEVRLEAWFLTC